MNRDMLKDGVLTAMDGIVLWLCIDCGFTPLGMVGACYVLLRFLNRDSSRVVDGLPGLIDRLTTAVCAAIRKARSRTDLTTEENEAK